MFKVGAIGWCRQKATIGHMTVKPYGPSSTTWVSLNKWTNIQLIASAFIFASIYRFISSYRSWEIFWKSYRDESLRVSAVFYIGIYRFNESQPSTYPSLRTLLPIIRPSVVHIRRVDGIFAYLGRTPYPLERERERAREREREWGREIKKGWEREIKKGWERESDRRSKKVIVTSFL